MRLYLILMLAMAGAVVAGCQSSVETVKPDPYALSERRLLAGFERLTDPVQDSASVAGRTLFAERRMQEDGLMPAFASGFLAPFKAGRAADPAQAHIYGYVPGRNPSQSGELVVVAVDMNSPAAAAALETARRLALEALDTQVPERSVLFALWATPRTGAIGLGDYLANPTWGREQIRHVLVVGTDSAGVSLSALERAGIASSSLLTPPLIGQATAAGEKEDRQSLVSFAETLHARVRSLALNDTTLASETR